MADSQSESITKARWSRLLWLLLAVPSGARATPLIALREANNCGACHTPGRAQRPVLDRRCTLDCQGCHVDPSGAGPRNQWGYYYSQDQLATVSFFKPADPLTDESRFDVHYDGRIVEQKTDDRTRVFPMASELSLRVRPFVNYLSLTYQSLLLGDVGDRSFRAVRSDHQRYREKFAVMVDNLPLDTYVRAYRGTPLYGLRRPNHTLWIRERLGLDEFAMTEAVEVGGTPNVPFMRASYMRGDPYANPEDRQKGVSYHAGLRGVSYAWHLNASGWETSSEKTRIHMQAVGAGLKPGDFLLMAERNWRRVTDVPGAAVSAAAATWETPASMTWPSSEISEYTAAYAGLTGVMPGVVVETLRDPATAGVRRSVFLDLHPIPFLQLEIWRRYETGTRRLADTLGVAHVYFDF